MAVDKQVAVKVICALSVVIVGAFFVYATQGNSNVSVETTTNDSSRILKEKRRKELLQQIQTLLFPNDICNGAPPNTEMTSVTGLCSYLNGGLQGCCTSTNPPRLPTDLPQIEPSAACTSTCLSMLYSLWCFVPCTDAIDSELNLQDRTPLCQETLNNTFNACNNCPAFGTYTNFAAYQTEVAQRVPVAATTGCTNFYSENRRLIVETAPPVVVPAEAAVTPNPVALSNTAQSATVMATIPVRQTAVNTVSTPPAFMLVSFRDPNDDVTNDVTKTSFDFVSVGNSRWQTTHSIQLGGKALPGTWDVYVQSVSNMNGTERNVKVMDFEVTNSLLTVPVTAWGNVQLCSGMTADNTGVPVLRLTGTQSAGTVTCCDNRRCEIRCGGDSNVNAVGRVTSATAPLTIQDCTITSTAGSNEWDLPSSTTVVSSPSVTFGGAGKIVNVGTPNALSQITSPDASKLLFTNGAVLQDLGLGSTVNLGMEAEFDATSALTLNANEQTFNIVGAGFITMLGRILMTNPPATTNPRATIRINPDASNRRNHLLVDGNRPTQTNANAGRISGRYGGSNSTPLNNLIDVVTGRFEVTRGAVVEANVRIGTTSQVISKKIATQQTSSNPADFVAEICCGSTCGHDITVLPNAAFFVIPREGSQEETCSDPSATQVAARITGDFTLGDNSRLVFTGVRTNGPFIVINGGLTVGQDVVYEVELASSNTNVDAFTITLLQWAQQNNDLCSAVNLQVVATNENASRPISQSCVTTNGQHQLRITIPAVQSQSPVSTSVPTFRSAQTYVITFNRRLTDFPESSFKTAIDEVTQVDQTQLDVLSYVEDSNNNLIATFQCLSSQSVQNADSNCASIVQDANTQGTSLNQRLNVINANQADDDEEDDDSNTALYGLFGLLILIPICIIAACLFLKNKRRKADNQYLQDTATFSNVAASPQNINYPYPYHGNSQGLEAVKPVPVVEPVIAVDAPPAYIA